MEPVGTELTHLLATELDEHFERLVTEFGPQLYIFAVRLTGSSSDAEDVVQTMFERAYLALSDYPEERIRALKLRPWLYKITLNVARNYISRSRLQAISLDESLAEGIFDIEDDEYDRPEHLFEHAERRRELEALVGALAPCYREAINLCFFGDLSYKETATRLNKSVGTIKFYVHRGIGLLRAMLERQMNEV
jgi:RNA polymerase sigma-70 factor (ECF subfamily)